MKKEEDRERTNFISIPLGGEARRWQEAPTCRLWAFFASREGDDSGDAIATFQGQLSLSETR